MTLDIILWLPMIAGFVLLAFPDRIKMVKSISSGVISAWVVYTAILLYFQDQFVLNNSMVALSAPKVALRNKCAARLIPSGSVSGVNGILYKYPSTACQVTPILVDTT